MLDILSSSIIGLTLILFFSSMPLFVIPDAVYKLETWALAVTIWGGFTSLAVIPLFQLFKKRAMERQQQDKKIEETFDDLTSRMKTVESKMLEIDTQISDLANKVTNTFTDVKVLQAIRQKVDDADAEDRRMRSVPLTKAEHQTTAKKEFIDMMKQREEEYTLFQKWKQERKEREDYDSYMQQQHQREQQQQQQQEEGHKSQEGEE